MHKSTVSRLLGTLERYGFVSRNSQTDTFSLGPALLSMAGAALERLDLRATARPHLERLAEQTQETINLALLDRNQVVNIDRLASPHAIHDIGSIGRRRPLHSTATGKALIAHYGRAARRRLVGATLTRYTPRTIGDWAALEEELAVVRRQGFATAWEELEPGLVAVAAPIRDLGGRVVATVSVSGPAFRMSRKAVAGYSRHVRLAAANISHALGSRPEGTRLTEHGTEDGAA